MGTVGREAAFGRGAHRPGRLRHAAEALGGCHGDVPPLRGALELWQAPPKQLGHPGARYRRGWKVNVLVFVFAHPIANDIHPVPDVFKNLLRAVGVRVKRLAA